MIPKIIHQTYKNTNLPPLYKNCQKIIKNTYSDYTYHFYTDKNMDTFVNSVDENFKKNVFDKLPTKIMKIDVFRYLLLYYHGGVYSDLDYELIRRYNFEEIEGVVLPLSVGSINDHFILGNCILGSIAFHPFWEKIINLISENINTIIKEYQLIKKNLSQYKRFVLNTTGPGMITRVYKTYFLGNEDIKLIDKQSFHPPQPKTKDDYKKLSNDDVFGFHHCSGSWMKY